MQQRHNDVHPPPEWWMPTITDTRERQAQWSSIGKTRRDCLKKNHRVSAQRNAARMARIADGNANRYDHLYVARGGMMHSDPVERGRTAATNRSMEYNANDALQFRLRYARGCSVAGCPLGPIVGGDTPNSQPLLCILEHDHRNPEEKVDGVMMLSGSAREQEVAKTDCKCLWHHAIHTREHTGVQAASEPRSTRTHDTIELRHRRDRTRCEHPLHDSMSYASLVPTSAVDPLVFSFMTVTQISCRRIDTNSSSRLTELELGQARIFCRFCHAIHRMCGRWKTSNIKGVTSHDYELLLRTTPAFIQCFDDMTSDVDWTAQAQATKKKMSDAAKSRKRKSNPVEADEREREEETEKQQTQSE